MLRPYPKRHQELPVTLAALASMGACLIGRLQKPLGAPTPSCPVRNSARGRKTLFAVRLARWSVFPANLVENARQIH
jgi:hypothetical protein